MSTGVADIRRDDVYIQSSDQFKYKLLEVGISEGTARDIDQFFFQELSIANYDEVDRTYIIAMFKALRMYLYASRKNARSGRVYNLVPAILRCYESARTVAITSKGLRGWGMQQVLHPRSTTIQMERIESEQYQGKKSKGFFSSNKQPDELTP